MCFVYLHLVALVVTFKNGGNLMATIKYGTGINKGDVVVCASKISVATKTAEVGKKFANVKSLNTVKSQELSF